MRAKNAVASRWSPGASELKSPAMMRGVGGAVAEVAEQRVELAPAPLLALLALAEPRGEVHGVEVQLGHVCATDVEHRLEVAAQHAPAVGVVAPAPHRHPREDREVDATAVARRTDDQLHAEVARQLGCELRVADLLQA